MSAYVSIRLHTSEYVFKLRFSSRAVLSSGLGSAEFCEARQLSVREFSVVSTGRGLVLVQAEFANG